MADVSVHILLNVDFKDTYQTAVKMPTVSRKSGIATSMSASKASFVGIHRSRTEPSANSPT